MSSAITRTEYLFVSPSKSQSKPPRFVSGSYTSSDVILDSVLSKQTNHGVGGSSFWNERRFKLYSDRIECGLINSTIYLKDIHEVLHHPSKYHEFIIKLKNNREIHIKSDTQDDKEIWMSHLSKLLSRESEDHISTWRFNQSEKQHFDSILKTNSKHKHTLPGTKTSLINGNTSQTMDKLINDRQLLAKYTNNKSNDFVRMSHVIEQKIKDETQRNNKLLFLNQYYPLRQIAFGPFGHIVLANDTFKNKNVILQLAHTHNMKHTVTESMQIMKDIKCKYCFQLMHNGRNEVLTYAVYSCDIWMRLSNVMALLPDKRMEEPLAVVFASQLLDLMSSVHKHHIIFNSMSPEELFITERGELYWMSFNPFVDAEIYIGNCNYAPPEYFSEGINDKISDLFRFGVFLYQILVGVPPFWDVNEESTVTRIENLLYEFPKFVSKCSRDLISKLLLKRRKKRIGYKNMDHIVKHSFFKQSRETQSLQMIINTFSFSSTDVWPSSIIVHDDSEVSKMIAKNKGKANANPSSSLTLTGRKNDIINAESSDTSEL
eukprot:314316_1